MDITPSLRKKMLNTAKTMKEQSLSYLEVVGADGFFVTLDESQKNAIILGAEKFEGKTFFLCQMDE